MIWNQLDSATIIERDGLIQYYASRISKDLLSAAVDYWDDPSPENQKAMNDLASKIENNGCGFSVN